MEQQNLSATSDTVDSFMDRTYWSGKSDKVLVYKNKADRDSGSAISLKRISIEEARTIVEKLERE